MNIACPCHGSGYIFGDVLFAPEKDQDNLVNDLWLKISESWKISLNFITVIKVVMKCFSLDKRLCFITVN